MELRLTRELLRFERLAGRGEEQVSIEGEATLPGSMRDAVTVLSVQAQAHVTGAQAGREEAGVRGRVCFQVLYTQGDLTRVRTLETSCDFVHSLPMAGVSPAMRLCADAIVLEADGVAGSGRIALRALVLVQAEAFERVERNWITGAQAEEAAGDNLQTRMQTFSACVSETLGENKALLREEFDLPAKLEIGEVLSATATALPGELSGGNGRIGVSGVVEVRVLHRARTPGRPLVMTTHEMPFDAAIDARPPEGMQLRAQAEIADVMADSVESDRGRTLRVEAQVCVRLIGQARQEMTLLADLYSLDGDALIPQTETLRVVTAQESGDVRESTRLQVSLPKDAPPIGTLLAAFAQPMITAATPAGKRLDTEGLMSVTLIYLPMDSDIPVAVRTREPFMMTFPVEAQGSVQAQAYPIETSIGATTSDRVELRLLLGLRTRQCSTQEISGVQEVTQAPQEKQEHGFVLVWPGENESRWETARRLRVTQESLRPAGRRALVAFRR